MKTKKQYSAPAITMVEFQMERGFFGSNQHQATSFLDLFPDQGASADYNADGQQNWATDHSDDISDRW